MPDHHPAPESAPVPDTTPQFGRQFAWWRPGGFRWLWLARLTRGHLAVGHWRTDELVALDARAQVGAKALRWCREHQQPYCPHGFRPDPR